MSDLQPAAPTIETQWAQSPDATPVVDAVDSSWIERALLPTPPPTDENLAFDIGELEVDIPYQTVPVPPNDIEFALPSLFRHGETNCEGDAFLRSSDGVYFCVIQSIVVHASPALRQLVHTTTDSLHHYPLVRVRHDAETICSLLQALYPGPALPITDLHLAYKCEAAAFSYNLSPAIFTYDRNLFSAEHKRNDPIGLCILAWNAGEWTLLEEASRWVHRADLVEALTLFREMPGGPQVIAALLATQMEREDCIRRVVEAIPRGIACHVCRSTGRNVVPAFVTAVADVFKSPNPDTIRLANNPSFLATPSLLRACRSKGCRSSLRRYKYTPQQMELLQDVIECVPQTISPHLVELQRANQRSVIQAEWEGQQITARTKGIEHRPSL